MRVVNTIFDDFAMEVDGLGGVIGINRGGQQKIVVY